MGDREPSPPTLGTIAREWGRIGVVGFGGPPAHVSLLRELVVERGRWLGAGQFEDGLAAVNLLPGPASTQLAIFTAWRTRGVAGALVGGASFVLPGLVLIVVLAALFLGSPPDWLRGAGAGAGAAVAAVAIHAGAALLAPTGGRVGQAHTGASSSTRSSEEPRPRRWGPGSSSSFWPAGPWRSAPGASRTGASHSTIPSRASRRRL